MSFTETEAPIAAVDIKRPKKNEREKMWPFQKYCNLMGSCSYALLCAFIHLTKSNKKNKFLSALKFLKFSSL